MRRPFPANFFALDGVIAMLKKLLMLCIALSLSLSAAFAAAVEVNTADEAALESVKGIGPVHAKAIIDERTKHGPFKDADDLAARVKGIGPKSVVNLEAAGLTINGLATPPRGKAPSAKSTAATSKPAMTAPSTAATTTATQAAPASAVTTAAASAPVEASGTKGGKPKKPKKSKAASATAASGT
jgi:competence protein ComEA